MLEPPTELKPIVPFLQRAAELKERDPVMSYYCKFYAVKMALEIGATTKEAKQFLGQLLDQLETDKKSMGTNEAISFETAGQAHVENFALKVFLNADNEDRQGRASKKTALTFLASKIFMEVLKQFGELEPQIEEKIKYAKWRAAEISKALKEGRQPVPPNSGSIFDELENLSLQPASDPAQPPALSPTVPPVQPVISPLKSNPPPLNQVPVFQPAPVQSSISNNFSAPQSYSAYDPMLLENAQKHCRYTISALQYDDISTAVDNLEKALAMLRPLDKRNK